jgi:histidine 2-aminobutanoyltransferase
MNNPEQFLRQLTAYQARFAALEGGYDGTLAHSAELAAAIDAYSALITDERNAEAWVRLEREASREIAELTGIIRKTSARCVAIMEKHRARRLLRGEADGTDYFSNIESCIEQEFGSFRVAFDSKVLMIGSGAFPMTPLYISRRTGAEVIGIDIDEEAVELGRQVVERLGSGLRIRLSSAFIEQLEDIRDVTHVIISSTVAIKYELLDRLHALTNPDVVVAMRYGNRLKSLFNYPMQEVDLAKWSLADALLRPGQVFDIALYTKARVAHDLTHVSPRRLTTTT